jgi:hypothetical protein
MPSRLQDGGIDFLNERRRIGAAVDHYLVAGLHGYGVVNQEPGEFGCP